MVIGQDVQKDPVLLPFFIVIVWLYGIMLMANCYIYRKRALYTVRSGKGENYRFEN